MADLFDRGQSPAALGWRRRVSELELSLENKVLFAACALRYEKPPFPIAAQALEEMRPVAETSTSYHLVASQLALKLSRLTDAESHLGRLERAESVHHKLTEVLLAGDGVPAVAATLAESFHAGFVITDWRHRVLADVDSGLVASAEGVLGIFSRP